LETEVKMGDLDAYQHDGSLIQHLRSLEETRVPLRAATCGREGADRPGNEYTIDR
jgi:hypothetical protein